MNAMRNILKFMHYSVSMCVRTWRMYQQTCMHTYREKRTGTQNTHADTLGCTDLHIRIRGMQCTATEHALPGVMTITGATVLSCISIRNMQCTTENTSPGVVVITGATVLLCISMVK